MFCLSAFVLHLAFPSGGQLLQNSLQMNFDILAMKCWHQVSLSVLLVLFYLLKDYLAGSKKKMSFLSDKFLGMFFPFIQDSLYCNVQFPNIQPHGHEALFDKCILQIITLLLNRVHSKQPILVSFCQTNYGIAMQFFFIKVKIKIKKILQTFHLY